MCWTNSYSKRRLLQKVIKPWNSRQLGTLLARKKRRLYHTSCMAALVAFQQARVWKVYVQKMQRGMHNPEWIWKIGEICKNSVNTAPKPKWTEAGDNWHRAKSFQSPSKDNIKASAWGPGVYSVNLMHKGGQSKQNTGNFTSDGGTKSRRRKMKPKRGDRKKTNDIPGTWRHL